MYEFERYKAPRIRMVEYIKDKYGNMTVQQAMKNIEETFCKINFSDVFEDVTKNGAHYLVIQADGDHWLYYDHHYEPASDEAVLGIDDEYLADIFRELPYDEEKDERYVTEKEDFAFWEIFRVDEDLALGDALEGDGKTLLENMIEKHTRGMVISEDEYSECNWTREELQELGIKIIDRYRSEWDMLSEE